MRTTQPSARTDEMAGTATNSSDPQLANLDGLNLSRTWMLGAIAPS